VCRRGWLGRGALLESFLSAIGVPSQRPCCRSTVDTATTGGGKMAWGAMDEERNDTSLEWVHRCRGAWSRECGRRWVPLTGTR
jgi:hypothetical protein